MSEYNTSTIKDEKIRYITVGEFKVGNWVMGEAGRRIEQVHPGMIQSEWGEKWSKQELPFIGIPLTVEMVEHSDFTEREKFFDQRCFELGPYLLTVPLKASDKYVIFKTRKGLPSEFVYHVEFVHELQNILREKEGKSIKIDPHAGKQI
ncbi:MAG TPA: hypothetical protein PK339_12445 [Flavitalea sp.]|nr:hypothetical protein [Flavitalea sp.]